MIKQSSIGNIEYDLTLREPIRYFKITTFKLYIVNEFNWEDHLNILKSRKINEDKHVNLILETQPIKIKIVK